MLHRRFNTFGNIKWYLWPKQFPYHRQLITRDFALLCESHILLCGLFGFYFYIIYLTNPNLEMCFFPREQLCWVWEKDIPSLIYSTLSAPVWTQMLLRESPLQSLSFPGNPLNLGKPDVRKGYFIKTTTRGQPLPPSHAKNSPSTSQIQPKRLFSLFKVPWW